MQEECTATNNDNRIELQMTLSLATYVDNVILKKRGQQTESFNNIRRVECVSVIVKVEFLTIPPELCNVPTMTVTTIKGMASIAMSLYIMS